MNLLEEVEEVEEVEVREEQEAFPVDQAMKCDSSSSLRRDISGG